MKLLLVTTIIGQNGARSSSRSEFDKRQVVVGRGAASDIRIESRYISLKHFVLYERDSELVVEDFGSLSGILVNGSLVNQKSLSAGDLITAGDSVFTVVRSAAPFEISLTVDRSQPLDQRSQVEQNLSRLDPTKKLSMATILSGATVLMIILGFFIYPLTQKSRDSWSPGPLSSAHRVLERNCSSCHAGDFSKITDEKCLSCHTMSDHAQREVEDTRLCVDCHAEHRGEGSLKLRSSEFCVTCHQSLQSQLKNQGKTKTTELKNVKNFDLHPELRRRYADDDGTRDFKFSHAVHMEPNLATRDSEKTLQCASCHELSADGRSILKIDFERHCHDCHSLEFEEKLPGKELSHGKNELVYKTLLQYQNGLTESVERVEDGVFNRTTCILCHEVKKSSRNSPSGGHFEVVRPQFQLGKFEDSMKIHRSHQAASCESCHLGAFESELARDDLRPSFAACRECHSSEKKTGKIQSSCSFCHGYHRGLSFDSEKPRLMRAK